MMSNVCSCFFILIYLTFRIYGARILAFYPTPSISHQMVFRPLTNELLKRGHEVVVVTTDPAFPKGQTPENLTEIYTGELSYKLWQDGLLTSVTGDDDLVKQMMLAYRLFDTITLKQIQYDKVRTILEDKDKKFDLLLLESCAKLALSLTHILKIPAIQVSSMATIYNQYTMIGAPSNSMIYPEILRLRLQNLTFSETVSNAYIHYQIYNFFKTLEDEENAILIEMFGPDAPTMNDLSKNVAMIFSNISPLWEGIRPVPKSVLYIGGLHQSPVKELPQDLNSYLDSSMNGVIYVSFGTNVNLNLVPREKIEIFVNVLAHLPYDVIWKWDSNEVPTDAKNIKFVKWTPQYDLLRHPKIKLFICQGGLQSSDEAIEAGLPFIGIPMLGDQYFNVEKYLEFGIGVKLYMDSITEDKLRDAITTAIEDDSYRRNVARLHFQIRDQPESSLSRAIWWTEHVLRYGGAHLQAPAANMHWTVKLEINLIVGLILEYLIYLNIVIIILYYLLKRLCGYTRQTEFQLITR